MNKLYDIAPSVSYRYRGELIKITRKKLGLSQKYVAAKVKMTQSALSKIESGINEMPRKILEISDLLHIKANDIMSIGSSHESKNISDSEFLKEINSKLPNWKNVLMEAVNKA